MVEYLKTKKGYFYKLKKNGEKKRISQEEYNKKNKTRKNKKMIGGGPLSLFTSVKKRVPIVKSDIMYQDHLTCILKPHVKKGILVYSHFTQPEGTDSLCKLGLKTGKQLQKEGIYFGRSKIHPYMFFRAPYYSRDIDYTTPETEIISSFGQEVIGQPSTVFIRVDPDNTYVFSSEIRVKYPDTAETKIENSKKTLSEYLKIINDNIQIVKNVKPNEKKRIMYNIFTSKAEPYPSKWHPPPVLDWNPIERNSEILVFAQHLTPKYFVRCTE